MLERILIAMTALNLTALAQGPDGGAKSKLPFWELEPAKGSHPPKTDVRLVLRPEHPRLIFRPAGAAGPGRTFEEVRRLSQTDPTFQAIFKKALEIEPGRQQPAANAACWIVTQDDKYVDAAIHTMLTVELGKSGEPDYTDVWSYALAYDWMFHHPKLTQEVKDKIVAKILERLGTELAALDDHEMALWHGRNQAANGVMIAALAVGDLPGQEEMLRRATAHYVDSLKALDFSEGWPEGASYWIYNRAGPYGRAADCVITATGSDQIGGLRIREVMKKIGFWSLYQFGPNEVFEPYGDSAGSIRLGETGWWELTVDHYARLARDHGLMAGADYLRNRSPVPYGKRAYYWNIVLTYDPSARPRTDYDPAKPELWMRTHLPQSMLFGRRSMATAFFRGAWGDTNELYASFKAGDLLAHHDHYDVGTFTLQRGGELVPQSGQYGDYTGPHRLGYYVQTVAANSILVLAPGETSGYLKWKWPERAGVSGGQRVIRPTSFSCVGMAHFLQQLNEGPHLKRSDVLAWRSEPGKFDYIAADITPAYNSTRWAEPGSQAKVSLVTRQFLYLRPEEAFVIFDRVETTDAKFLPKFLLHTRYKPATESESVLAGVSTNGILATQDRKLVSERRNGRLTQLVLLPERVRTLKIGGPDYCFYAEADGDQANGFNGVNYYEGTGHRDKSSKKVDQWRVEVEPTASAKGTRFLNVLLPRLTADASPLPGVKMLDAGPDAVAVAVGATTVVFSGSGKPLPRVETDVVPGGRCLVLDAERGAAYIMEDQALQSDTEGVLLIPNAAGSRIIVERRP